MTKSTYDLIVVGGGSGGVRAARVASNHGAKVCVIEEYRLGGTCVIRGCVPKKLFTYAANYADSFDLAASFGWTVDAQFDWNVLRANKDKEIGRLEGLYGLMLDGAKVETYADRGVISGLNSVTLKNSGQTLTANKILIATGAQPFFPDLPGIEHAISSNEAFDLEQLPETIMIVGGGYIAVEFAGIFNSLGVQTTLAYRGGQIMRGFDDDVRTCLHDEMSNKGINIVLGTTPIAIERTPNGVEIICNDESEREMGAIMFATGRTPNTQGLGLETAGIELGKKGEILVDEYSGTSCPSIFAVGDVTDRAALTPVAIREGQAFAETEFNNNPITVDHSIIPTAVFSNPEIGTVGLSEAEAVVICSDIDVYVSRFKPMNYSFTTTQSRILIKLITEHATGKVLGVHIVGFGSGEMIQMVGIAVTMGVTKHQLNQTIAVHPTAAEELVTFKAPNYRIKDGEKLWAESV